jgi:hypothetical protein
LVGSALADENHGIPMAASLEDAVR